MHGLMYRFRLFSGLVICFTAAFASSALGQSTAPLVTVEGSTVEVDLGFTAGTSYGELSGTDTDSEETTGTALLTLFPTDPDFTHATLQSMYLQVGQMDFHYSFVYGLVQIDVTLTDLELYAPGPAFGTIEPNGDALFPEVALEMSGTAHVVSGTLGIDETMIVDDTTMSVLDARITEGAGLVTLDGIVVPPFQGEADPADLPAGITFLVIDVAIDAANVHLRGAHGPALLGDWDVDDDIDLLDFAAMADCMMGPGVAVEPYCTLFDFDGDTDVDALDFGGFQAAFTSP